MNLSGVDISLENLVFAGWGISFGFWALSRGVRFLFELVSARSGYIRPE